MKKLTWTIVAVLGLGAAVWGCTARQSSAKDESAVAAESTPAIPSAEDAVQTSDAGTTVSLFVTSDGFVPAKVHVPAGKPVTLQITRKTEKTCAKEFVMAVENIHQALPLNQAVEVTFTPQKAGELRYACGMDMVSGTIVVD